ncbi:CxC ATPase DNA modification system associated small protein [Shewanella sp. ALD9]|uniref:CxC ATPase DNA modification system associated small protein n=1 Tax=Shewanella sp. ALD9 TaxID=2058330 RepID=UPI000C333B9D|nr:CxC ATPase DNA modification system associated small protein [Shewanella sp. ALD9]PKH32652.1 hypothetical protein CXF88_12540 [Shewanella sp. ALD9]|tara:strand:+ start:11637 stop:11867 length:231 start_codon:yes stop_codon:yes gene_type:complete
MKLNLDEFKALLIEADIATETAHNNYSKKSAVHKAALQIIQFEKDLYYGETVQSRHLQKIKDIIESNSEDIVNEIN